MFLHVRLTAVFPFLAASAVAQAGPLNDTGQTLCYNSSGATIPCTAAPAADDGRFGRDAAANAGVLPKTGKGAAGFDFTKIDNNGNVLAATATLATTTPPAASTDWACTRDNVTGLTWEMKTPTAGDLRYTGHTYTWYSTDGASNGGDPGNVGTDTCAGTLSAYANQCNTANYVAAVNAAALCGYTDWRLPSLKELQSLVDFSVPATNVAPTIDANYFPNTQINRYWSARNYANDPTKAWRVHFSGGHSATTAKGIVYYVRLVRGGQ